MNDLQQIISLKIYVLSYFNLMFTVPITVIDTHHREIRQNR